MSNYDKKQIVILTFIKYNHKLQSTIFQFAVFTVKYFYLFCKRLYVDVYYSISLFTYNVKGLL